MMNDKQSDGDSYNAVARRELGVLYEEGRGVEKNQVRALACFERPAGAGELGQAADTLRVARGYACGA